MKKTLDAVLYGLIGGNVASFAKWGTEVPFPPRVPGRPIPPLEMLSRLGIDASRLTYEYSGHVVNYGSAAVHQAFSVAFAIAYCTLAEYFRCITLWQGAAFGLAVTFVFHGIVLPAFSWAPPLWQLPLDEIVSELFGHLLWMWVIELIRQALKAQWAAKRSMLVVAKEGNPPVFHGVRK